MSPPRATAIDRSVDAFLSHAALERNLSPRTVEAYGRDLARFADFLASEGVRSLSALERTHLSSQMLIMRQQQGRERLQVLSARNIRAFSALVERKRFQLNSQSKLLASLSHKSVLERGFALVRDEKGEMIRKAANVSAGQLMEIELVDGRILRGAPQHEGPHRRECELRRRIHPDHLQEAKSQCPQFHQSGISGSGPCNVANDVDKEVPRSTRPQCHG